MFRSPKYIAALVAFIGGSMGYVYAASEVQTVYVIGKHAAEGSDRRGRTTARLVIETDRGEMALLKFPVIGYSFGAEDVFERISAGQSLRVRVGQWPPDIISSHAKPHIMAVY